jgi:DNA-binding transcriptional ArsR family regulator
MPICMSDHLTMTFAALADPTRRAILGRLASGEASVTELAKPFAMSMPAICKHLSVLERAGLIARRRNARWRPRRLEAAPLHEVACWVEHYRQFWEKSVDRVGEYPHSTKPGSNRSSAVNKLRNNAHPGHADKAKSQSRRQLANI